MKRLALVLPFLFVSLLHGETLDALVARTLAEGGRELRLTDGVYRVEHPIEFGPAASGFRLVGTGRSVVTGARVWPGLAFSPCGNGIWRSATKLPLAPDGLLVGGKPLRMARFPNVVPGKPVYGVWDLADARTPDPARDPLAPGRLARWRNPRGAILHVMHHALWGDVQYRVAGRCADGSLDRKGGGQMNRFTRDHPVFRYIENVREELDQPGEWFYDAEKGELLVWPRAGQDLAKDVVEYTCLPSLVSIRGATNVTVSGLYFTGTRRTMMETVERILLSDWTLCRQAAVQVRDAKDCVFADCDFTDLGGNAIVFSGGNRGHSVVRSLFRDIGASGVVFAGEVSSVRSPRFDYDQTSLADVVAADRTPGPASEAYPRRCRVEDCLFTRTGREEKQTAAVTVFAASEITVRDCTVCDVPRAGINIGTGAFGGHLVEGCDVFDTVLETGDHGAFNSWGRDRFWTSELADVDTANAGDPALRFLDARRTTVLRANRWRCDHGWDVDLDDGSSNYLIEDNVMLAGGLKLREGYGRIARGNYILNNGLHAHCWLKDSHDVVTNNVFFAPIATAGRMVYWGDAVSPNVMATPENVPPMPQRRFGVRSPRLRALAREPEIPSASFPPPRKVAKPFLWRGMTLRAFDGPVEFSAYGVTPTTKGFVVTGGTKPPFADGDLLLGDAVPAVTAKSCEVVRRQHIVRLELGDAAAPLGPLHVTLTFDDNVRGHLDVAAPILEKYGYRGTFNIVTDTVGKDAQHLTWDDIRELKRRGHEIASHTATHPNLVKLLNDGRTNECVRQCVASHDIIKREVGIAPRFLCHPYVGISPEVNAIVREAGMTPMSGNRHNSGKETTIESFRAYLDERIAQGAVAQDLLFHGITPTSGGWSPLASAELFEAIVKELKLREELFQVKVVGYADFLAADAGNRPGYGLIRGDCAIAELGMLLDASSDLTNQKVVVSSNGEAALGKESIRLGAKDESMLALRARTKNPKDEQNRWMGITIPCAAPHAKGATHLVVECGAEKWSQGAWGPLSFSVVAGGVTYGGGIYKDFVNRGGVIRTYAVPLTNARSGTYRGNGTDITAVRLTGNVAQTLNTLYVRRAYLARVAESSDRELSIETLTERTKTRLYDFGTDVSFRIRGGKGEPKAQDVLDWRVADAFGKTRHQGRMPFDANSWSNGVTVTVPGKSLGSGYFQFHVALVSDDATVPHCGSRPAGFEAFGLMPSLKPLPLAFDDRSRFGAQGTVRAYDESGLSPLYGQLGLKWSYVNARPYQLRPTPDRVYEPESEDGLRSRIPRDYFRTNRAACLVSLMGPMPWAIRLPEGVTEAAARKDPARIGQSFPLKDPKAYAETLTAIMTNQERLRRIVRPNQSRNYYEVHWEPDLHWNGTDEEFVDYYRCAREALDKADPTGVLTAADFGIIDTGNDRLARLLKKGLGKCIGGFTTHLYITHGEWPEGSGLDREVRRLRELADTYVSKGAPIIQTEGGWHGSGNPAVPADLLAHAARVARGHLIALGEGCDTTFFFYLPDGYKYKDSMIDYGLFFNMDSRGRGTGPDNVAPKPLGMAVAAMTRLLEGTKTIGRLEGFGDGVYAYAFDRAGEVVFAAWSPERAQRISVETGVERVTRVDLMGNCSELPTPGGRVGLVVDEVPVYLTGLDSVRFRGIGT